MKPSAIIQLITIFFGMSAIYTSASYLLSTGIIVIQGLIESKQYYSEGASLYMLFIMVALAILGWFLIVKSTEIAVFITEKSGYANNLSIKTENNELLCIFIVFLALGDLLKHAPYFLNDALTVFTSHKKNEYSMQGAQAGNINWIVNILQVLLPILMIIFCRNLSNYFGKNLAMEGKFEVYENNQIDNKANNEKENG